MHLFARWQHLELDVDAVDLRNRCSTDAAAPTGCKDVNSSFEDLDIFQVGGVIFF